MDFKLTSKYKPTGDQPEAIRELTEGIKRGDKSQVLLGVTGSGKTFTMANVIANVNKPTLILSHNKTLAAQLFEEMKGFFPQNAVEYYVSYYDYYQPEAYLPSTDTYIEKDLAINDEIDKLRLSAVSALLSGRKDVIVVSSVSCIYGMGGPVAMRNNVIQIKKGQILDRNIFLRRLVDALYVRNDIDLQRGNFRVKGDTVDIAMAYSDNILRVTWWDDEIDAIEEVDSISYHRLGSFEEYEIYPANLFVTSKEQTEIAIRNIQDDLVKQIDFFNEAGDSIKAQRIKERVEYDIEMIKELGHCSGIENYSRYFDGREEGQRPYCLLDFFPKDNLIIIDESHVSVPQISAMYGGDRARKKNLVEFGFRLPAAFDNRPLKFEEFHSLIHQIIYVSATPANFELEEADGVVVEQLIRPTGLLDPEIEVRSSINQIDDLMGEIIERVEKYERILVTTLTKRMAEELTEYLLNHNVKAAYIHSNVANLDRIKIINDLRSGIYDVLVGVNLLREGLDLPEVSLVAILDADKEGFLRSHRSLTQTAGRAARNVNGKVIMYADSVTESMRKTIDETLRRREKQLEYNAQHHITPTQIKRSIKEILPTTKNISMSANIANEKMKAQKYNIQSEEIPMVADPIVLKMTKEQLEKSIQNTTALMKEAAKNLDFLQAAQYRDEILRLQAELEQK
ncbi:MAG: excinuclease ABC subunit UvrB [Prevotella pallens]|jgi:excinuclease ABC, B subunit|uniref:excinuclease ABC subunit UvrB n=1 Tax=Prevotella pallens TaxID=60133 RepID=UPI001CAEA135|nr:excinuclease ABC subunit UvrB [Prevotella pallens]MBF1442924.1 excinuclease ABC subunit UvrB [Prevotella pallens]MBF1458377.1 excinuclease ABC subunit UvrB [Prevotella pallens]MBF1481478.1 excinuclease ABC subunit UvrB [Prevotella pallens]MBF1485824.1 excinuclease ABC subunit UvrB [Prevotella pallens]MBF1490060.1 excinuclease ABC subunit UvrB [Prevotella pallens]